MSYFGCKCEADGIRRTHASYEFKDTFFVCYMNLKEKKNVIWLVLRARSLCLIFISMARSDVTCHCIKFYDGLYVIVCANNVRMTHSFVRIHILLAVLPDVYDFQ